MAKKIKISRKQLKQPDEFITWSERAWDWGEEHVWEVAGALVGVVVFFLLGQFLIGYIGSKSREPQVKMAAAMEAINRPVTAGSQGLLPGMAGQGFLSENDKNQTVMNLLNRVIDDHPKTKEAELAKLYMARYNEKMGDWEKALLNYDEFLDTDLAARSEEFKNSAILGLARSSFEAGQYDKALENYDKIIDSGSTFKPAALEGAARSAFLSGEKDKAMDYLATLKKEYPQSWIAKPNDFLAKYWKDNEELYKNKGEVDEEAEGGEAVSEPLDLGGKIEFEQGTESAIEPLQEMPDEIPDQPW